ncbi:MAG: hypothetical protein HY704_16130 [Gemmatimonadetes bacterium]|nr:hypothetical protein [Gemmatimonadota bacterium]
MTPRSAIPSGAPRQLQRPARRTPGRRPYLFGFSVSLVVHALAVVLYPVVMRSLRPAVGVIERGVERRPAGIQVVVLREPSGAPEEVAPTPERRRPEAERPVPAQPGPAAADRPGPAAGGRAPTAAERLRPRLGDPRLWRPPDEALTRLTPEERMRIRLYVTLEAINDSLAAEADAVARATDWTITDKDGNRWGVSPGQIHLGKITLPLPVGFVAPPGKRQEAEARMRDASDLERGAAAAQAQEVWKERAKAIRERKDRERAEREQADTTGARQPPP